jgi:tetraacyldisaccharide 4'-kinase
LTRSLSAGLEALAARHWWQARPTWLARMLWPLTLITRAAVSLRQRAEAPALPVPVLVVGNLVVGGAGKTPTVIALVEAFQRAGRRPGVISRGFGRNGEAPRAVERSSPVAEVGDEPVVIARRTSVPVFVARERKAAALALLQAHPEVDLIVADDGLQHHRLHRDAELVVFDERGAGNGWLIPAGPLREPMPVALGPKRSVLYTTGIASTLLPGQLGQRTLGLAWPLVAWRAGDRAAARPLNTLRGRPLAAAAGLAMPARFFAMLRDAGLTITEHPLRDHDAWHTLPWPAGTPEAVVTEKDAVKIDPARCGNTAVWVLPLDLTVPAALVETLLVRLLPPRTTAP